MKGRYQVVVGNIGTVYDGDSTMDSIQVFEEYIKVSKGGTGRGGNEKVARLVDGEIFDEYDPRRDSDCLDY
jgi:hypothetical protein